jgi:hypothetical protein
MNSSITIDPSLLQAIRISLIIGHATLQPYGRPERSYIASLDKAIDQLLAGTPFHFDPCSRILTIASVSEPGVLRTCDGRTCDCPGARHAHHWHLEAWHLIVTYWTLTAPLELLDSAALVSSDVEDYS